VNEAAGTGSIRLDLLSDDMQGRCEPGAGGLDPLSDSVLISETTSTSLAFAQPDGRKPAPRTVYDFRRRDGQHLSKQQHQHQSELDDIKQMQRERYKQFQSDPHAKTSVAYVQPPSGCYNESKPKATKAEAQQWLSEKSKHLSESLKGTSERFSSRLSDASEHLSSGISAVTGQLAVSGWWQAGQAPNQQEAASVAAGPLPGRFQVVSRTGAMVRQGIEKDTAEVDILGHGTQFVGLELQKNSEGVLRLRLEAPLRGWLTLKPDIVEQVPEDPAEFG